MEKRYEKLGPLLIDYCQEMTNDKYVDNDWFEYNKMWEKCREYNGVCECKLRDDEKRSLLITGVSSFKQALEVLNNMCS